MSRASDNGRGKVVYDIDTYGVVRTPTEAKRFRKSIRKKKLAKKARKANRR